MYTAQLSRGAQVMSFVPQWSESATATSRVFSSIPVALDVICDIAVRVH